MGAQRFQHRTGAGPAARVQKQLWPARAGLRKHALHLQHIVFRHGWPSCSAAAFTLPAALAGAALHMGKPYYSTFCSRVHRALSGAFFWRHRFPTHSLQTVQASIKLYSHSSCNIRIATRTHHIGKRKAQAPPPSAMCTCSARGVRNPAAKCAPGLTQRTVCGLKPAAQGNKTSRAARYAALHEGRPAATGNLSAQPKVST